MLRNLRPSPALIVASLALVVAASGSGYAAATISGHSTADRSTAAKANIVTRKVFYAPKHKSTTPTTILHLGGLVLKATCGNGDLDAVLTSTVAHSHLASEMYNSAGGGSADGLHHSDFGPHSAFHFGESLGDGNAYGETSFTYTRKNGTIVNGQLSFDSSDLNPLHPGDGDIFDHAAKCLVSGFVTSTTTSR
jgi:hypothetical protein